MRTSFAHPLTRSSRISLVLAFAFFSSTAFGAEGPIVYKKSGCDYFIVETQTGFCLLEWFGGSDPDTGDILVGEFESYGMKNIHNATKERSLRVWVEDYQLSKRRVLEKYFTKCGK